MAQDTPIIMVLADDPNNTMGRLRDLIHHEVAVAALRKIAFVAPDEQNATAMMMVARMTLIAIGEPGTDKAEQRRAAAALAKAEARTTETA